MARRAWQGMSEDRKEELAGRDDALRVIAGQLPARGLREKVSDAYRRGWEEAAAESLALLEAS